MRVDVNTNHAALYSHWKPSLSLLKQQVGLTHRYTIVKGTEKKTWPVLNRPTRQPVMFLRKHKDKHFLWTRHFDRNCVCNPAV